MYRTADLHARADWNSTPPAIRPAHAVIDSMLAAPDTPAMFRILTEAAYTRIVWPELLREALQERRRVPRRRLILDLINDLASGSQSVLERGFAALARAHGLPPGQQQARERIDGKVAYRDVWYADQRLVVELDGQGFHDGPRSRDADAARDLAAAESGLTTVRLTYGQVFRDGCTTAARLGAILRSRGWTRTPTSCPQCD